MSPDSFVTLKQTVALTRGLPFRREVAQGDKILFGRGSDDEYPPESIARLSQVYKRLGLLPDSTDFAKALTDFQRLQRIVFYDSQAEAVVVAPESRRLGRALADDDSRAGSLSTVLALTYALQEQNFHWNEMLKFISLEDRRLAFRALTRGDAVLMGLVHLGGKQPVRWEDQARAIGRLGNELDRISSHLPQLLRDKLVFPYRDGAQFVQWAYAAKGSQGINALFADPPLSSAQILHPEKYYIQRQNPLRIVPWSLMQQMKNPAVVDQTIGEYLIQRLLAGTFPHVEAAQIASGWAGDHVSAYRDGENLITCWISAWDQETKAQAFARAFQVALEQRHRWRFRTSTDQKGSIKAEIGAGRSALIQVRGPLVVFLDGVASTREIELTERIWQELETTTESTVIPFDSGRLNCCREANNARLHFLPGLR